MVTYEVCVRLPDIYKSTLYSVSLHLVKSTVHHRKDANTCCMQGRFEILSLVGSFLVTESGIHQGRTGGLSVSLAAPDGSVLGGRVAGLLIAASPVQV